MTKIQFTRARVITAVALLVVVALVVTFLVVQSSGLRTARGVTLTPAADEAVYDITDDTPIVDSQNDVGASLTTDDSGRIHVPDAPDGHDGALVRVTLFDVDEATTVFAAGGPALTVPAGSASTTVLVPIIDGGLPIYGDREADLRVDLLATFAADPNAPGSTIALEDAVTRADTTQELAGPLLDTTGLRIGVVGRGDVPATGVRAVHVSATVDVDEATTLTIDGQQAPIPAGTTTITTVATPDADGTIGVSLAEGSGDLRVDVRGWVPEAPQNMDKHNVAGSFVASSNAEPQQLTLTADTPVPVALDDPADGAYALTLITAQPAADPGFVTLDSLETEPTEGAVNDADAGTQAQLILSPVEAAHAHISAGSTEATVLSVGVFLAAEPTVDSAPELEIQGPSQEATVDLTDHGVMQLHGTLDTPGASIETVMVVVNNSIVGTPTLRHEGTNTRWEFDTSVPASGHYEFDIIATDRSGQQATQSVQLAVQLPDAADVVISEDAIVLPADPGVIQVQDDSVLFAEEPDIVPGEIMISDTAENAPDGFLRRVDAIDSTEDGWLLTTSPATLTEVIRQAEVADEVDLLAVGDPEIHHLSEPVAGDTTNTEILDDGQPAVTLVQDADVDLAPYPHEGSEVQGVALQQFSPRTAVPATFGIDTTLTRALKLEAGFAADISDSKTFDLTNSNDQTKADIESEIQLKGGISAGGEAQVSVSLRVALEILPHWNWGRPEVIVEDFRVIASTATKAEAEAKLTAGLTADVGYTKDFGRTVADVKLAPVTFAVGPVPVVITSDLILKAKGAAEVKIEASSVVSLTATTAVEHTSDYGFTYSTRGGFTEVDEKRSSYQEPTFAREVEEDFSGGFETSFGPELSLDIGIYDAAGPTFSVGALPGVDASIDLQTGEFTASVFVGVNAKGSVELKVPVIDTVLLTADLLSFSTKLTLREWMWDYQLAFPAPDDAKIVETSTNWRHSLARTSDGQVYAWGANLAGALGSGETEDRLLDPVLVSGLSDVVALAAGEDRSFAVTDAGEVYAWGLDYPGGGLGLGSGDAFDTPTPTKIPGLSNIVSIESAGDNTFAVTADGEVYAWGFNSQGALGLGHEDMQSEPTKVPGLRDVAQIASGGHFTFAVTRGGEVYAWGDNVNGQLGIGSTDNKATPVVVPALSNIAGISAASSGSFFPGLNYALAVTQDGKVYGWGNNDHGLLGDDAAENQTMPVELAGLADITSITVGADLVFAVDRAGEVYAWGATNEGPVSGDAEISRLGFSDGAPRQTPTLIPGLPTIQSVSSGGGHSVAVTDNGKVYTWGISRASDAHDPAPAEPHQVIEQPVPTLLEFPEEASMG